MCVLCGSREKERVALTPSSVTSRSGMGMGMLRPYCKTRCGSVAKAGGTATPVRRASRCNDTHPSRKKAEKASLFEGRSSAFMTRQAGEDAGTDVLPPECPRCKIETFESAISRTRLYNVR